MGDNLMVTEDGKVYIIDFGSSRHYSKDMKLDHNFGITEKYFTPKCIKFRDKENKEDSPELRECVIFFIFNTSWFCSICRRSNVRPTPSEKIVPKRIFWAPSRRTQLFI